MDDPSHLSSVETLACSQALVIVKLARSDRALKFIICTKQYNVKSTKFSMTFKCLKE